jgi:hypothetical protein
VWNEELATFDEPSWLNGPWLYLECSLYRRLHDILSRTEHWQTYDVFNRQKLSTFKKSKAAITELAQRYRSLVTELERGIHNPEAQKQLFVSIYSNISNLRLRLSRYLCGVTLPIYQCFQIYHSRILKECKEERQ